MLFFSLSKSSNDSVDKLVDIDPGVHVDVLIGGVGVLDSGAKRDSLHAVLGVLVHDDAALETSVDGGELGLGVEEGLVDLDGRLAEGGVGVSGPAGGVSHLDDRLAAVEGSGGCEVVGEGGEALVLGRAGKDLSGERALERDVDHREGLRSLDELGDLLAPDKDAVVDRLEEAEGSASRGEGEGVGGGSPGELGDNDLGGLEGSDLNAGVAGEELGELLADGNDELGGDVLGEGDLDGGERGDGVVGVAGVELDDAVLSTSDGDVVVGKALNDPLEGVGAAGLDLNTRVSALEVLVLKAVDVPVGVQLSALDGDVELAADTTSAGEADFTPVLTVDVDEVLGVGGEELALLEVRGADKAGLLVDGEKELERATDKSLVSGDGESGGNTRAIISTEGGVGGTEEVTIEMGDDGILGEVVDLIRGLGGNHIKMTLEDNGGAGLLAGGGGEGDGDVADGVNLHGTAELLALLLSPLAGKLGVVRGTGNLGKRDKVLPDIGAVGVLLAELVVKVGVSGKSEHLFFLILLLG